VATRNIEKTESPQKDFRAEFTEKVVAAIESGEKLPWEKPWVAGDPPRNATTGKDYNGMNRLILAVQMMEKGYTDPRFLTFKQAISLDGAVNKGEKGVQIEKWTKTEFWQRRDVSVTLAGRPVKIDSVDARGVVLDSGQTAQKSAFRIEHDGKDYTWAKADQELSRMASRAYTVFNVQQCHDLKLEPLPERKHIEPEQRLVGIQRALTEFTGLQFEEKGDEAYYSPARDTVTTPPPGAFHSLGDYQSILLHEIGHATGAEHRLARPGVTGKAPFGSPEYAKEELRAELFSAFAAMETGITRTRDTQHQAYLQSWAEVLKKDKNEIFRAAADAAKAVDYVKEKELAFEQKVDRIFKALGGVEQESAPQKAPHEMPFAQFAAAAQVQALPENHGRKYEVFMGKESLGFADGDSTEGALRQAHKREVNNALYGNQPGVPDDFRKSMPPKEVLSEYPDLEKKWAGVIYMHDHPEAGLKPLSRSDIEPGLDLVDKQGRMHRVVDVQHKEWATTTTERDLDTGALTTMLYKDGTDVIRATRLSVEAVEREKQQQVTQPMVEPAATPAQEPVQQKGKFKSVEIDAPAAWGSALVNRDESGLAPREAASVKDWVANQGIGWPVSMSDQTFTGRHEGLLTEMATYTFLVPEKDIGLGGAGGKQPTTCRAEEQTAIRPDLWTHKGAAFDMAVTSNAITPAYNEPRVTGRFVGIATDSENGEKLPWMLVQRMGKTVAIGVKARDLEQLPKDIQLGDAVRVRQHVRGPGGEVGAQIESLEKRHQKAVGKGLGLER